MLFQGSLLSLLIWVPIFGGALVLAIGRNERHVNLTRLVALIFSLITLGLCMPLLMAFNPNDWHMQCLESHVWIPQLDLAYSLGVDGISVLFIILTCFVNLIIILANWRSNKPKNNQCLAIFLISTGIMNGVFSATEAILFYFFWEASMIPMYLGMGIWGGKNRAQAAMKFFLITFLGSIFLLIAFLYLHSQANSFVISDFQNLNLSQAEQDWIFLAFLAAFAVKIPMWPVHTWLPDAHSESPTGGSVILAALMLKMGAYGFLRFSLTITPGIHIAMIWFVIALGLMAIVYVGLASIAQKDLKQLVAYSSISHMGIVILGIFMVFMILGQSHNQGHNFLESSASLQGAIFQMIAHAFSSGALFIGVGYMIDRFHSRKIKDYQGLAHAMPIFAAFFMLFAMANVGLPGTSGFVGEFLVLLAAFKANIWIALLASMTLILAPAYTLWMYKRVLFGQAKSVAMSTPNDLDGLEIFIFILLAIPVIVFGIYPEAILNLSHATTAHFIQQVMAKIPQGVYSGAY